MKNIAVLVDFTEVSEVTIAHAALIAKKSGGQIMLIHIAHQRDAVNEVAIKEELNASAFDLEAQNISFKVHVEFGDFHENIARVLAEQEIGLAIVGTHGLQGVQQNLYNKNIFKLIRSMNVLTMVVQKHSELPKKGFQNIVIPVMNDVYKINHADVLAAFAKNFEATINVLNFVFEDDADGISAAHIELVKNQFLSLGRPLHYDQLSTTENVESYSKPIAHYARVNKCQLVVWGVPTAAEDDKQFSSDDKMDLILNRQGVPVLYVPR